MSTAIWPPVSEAVLRAEESESLVRELDWLLASIQDTLQSLKAGLDECRSLLAPTEHGSTLVLSSLRSEAVKGFVIRNGSRVTKGDIKLRLPTLPPPKGSQNYPVTISASPQAPTLVLDQLTVAQNSINACLDVIDASTWGGDPRNARFIAGQLRLLDVNIQEAKSALKGGEERQPAWWQFEVDENVFEPALPHNLSFMLSIYEAALLLEVRTLEPAAPSKQHSSMTFREQLAVALGGTRPAQHDETDDVFNFRGAEVRVREKVRVESQDPSLMAALAKLTALERSLALARAALDVVLGTESD